MSQAERVDAAAGWVEHALDGAGEPGLGQVADDAGTLDQADLPVLLGDDDDDRVGLLGDAERRTVTGPEALGLDRRLGQRQERPGRHDPVVADDHRPVVERRFRGEDRAQQVGRDVAVDHHTGLGHLFEAGLALEHDQGALAVHRQLRRGARDLIRDMDGGARLGRRQEPAEGADPADALERPPQLRLEDDDQGEQADDRAGLEDLREEAEVERDREGVDQEQDADADHQADRARPPDELEQPVDQKRGDPDVDDRVQVDLIEDRREERRHRARV